MDKHLMAKPFIVGLESTSLNKNEIEFIKTHTPWGIILFKRNCETPEQLRRLTDSIKNIYQNLDVPILIDQEGGRVARLKNNGWRSYPSAGYFYDLYGYDAEMALSLVRLNASLQASELRQMGININCAPMIDVRCVHAHDIIGDRSFSTNPEHVTQYGGAVISGLMDQGVLPVIKHIPGHGRSQCDSHHDLPIVPNALKDLIQDFQPFKDLNYAPLAMTAHILYQKLDAVHCATLSPDIIKHIIRGVIGFTGLLMSDDISMKALRGDMTQLTTNILSAGCDLVLHCNGNFDEMTCIANALPEQDKLLDYRTTQIFNHLFDTSSPRSDDDLLTEYNEILGTLLSQYGHQLTAAQQK
jgi:beta-N-acetylhexosaminidase